MIISLDPEDGQRDHTVDQGGMTTPIEVSLYPSAPSSVSTEAAKQRVQDVILSALRETLPRNRPLEAWEPRKLNARHISMCCDRAAGLLPGEIAAKTGMHRTYVNVILTHPDSLVIIAAIQSLNADKMTDINARLQGYAGEMLTGQVEVFRTTADKRLKVSVAQDILDRAGYGSRQQVDLNAVHRFVLPAAAAMGISQALDEDKRVADLDYSQFTGRKLGQAALESGAITSSQVGSEQPQPVVSASPDTSSELAEPELQRRSA